MQTLSRYFSNTFSGEILVSPPLYIEDHIPEILCRHYQDTSAIHSQVRSYGRCSKLHAKKTKRNSADPDQTASEEAV